MNHTVVIQGDVFGNFEHHRGPHMARQNAFLRPMVSTNPDLYLEICRLNEATDLKYQYVPPWLRHRQSEIIAKNGWT